MNSIFLVLSSLFKSYTALPSSINKICTLKNIFFYEYPNKDSCINFNNAIELEPPDIHIKFKSSFHIFKFFLKDALNLWTIDSNKQFLHTLSYLFVKLGGFYLHLKHTFPESTYSFIVKDFCSSCWFWRLVHVKLLLF